MDMANTVQAIVSASHLPLSLLIVGVGSADFAAMEVGLDDVAGRKIAMTVHARALYHSTVLVSSQPALHPIRSHAPGATLRPTCLPCFCFPPQALDSDDKRLQTASGQQAARDIVQFCELRPQQV